MFSLQSEELNFFKFFMFLLEDLMSIPAKGRSWCSLMTPNFLSLTCHGVVFSVTLKGNLSIQIPLTVIYKKIMVISNIKCEFGAKLYVIFNVGSL